MKEHDKVRTAFVENFHHVHWDAVKAFDLVINTVKISVDRAVAWVVAEAAKALALSPTTRKPTTRLIPAGFMLAKTVSDVLHCTVAHR